MKQSKTVDDYVNLAHDWQSELSALRQILLTMALDETIKWGMPCYTYQGKNVVGLGAFKTYFGLWFHQGALLSDSNSVLINAQEGTTRAQRQWRMRSASDIQPALVKSYIEEAIQLVRDNRRIAPRSRSTIPIPNELMRRLSSCSEARKAFESLRPAQKREYSEYIVSARRPDTKQRRIDKILPMILDGQGLNDRYR